MASSTITIAGRPVNDVGYGLMRLTWQPTPPSQAQAFAAMKEALKHGANFWNGGEIYGTTARNSLHLLQEYFTQYPEDVDQVVVSIKGGSKPNTLIMDGSPENTRRSIQECIDVLGAAGKKLDVWEAARVDPHTPIEVTMRAAREFVEAGTLGGVSLSEASADTIRRAHRIVPVVAVEVEFSLWSTEVRDNGVGQTCAELGIPIVAYAPLGRGFLTGQITRPEDIPAGDFRHTIPRFHPDHFAQNLVLVDRLRQLAHRKGSTPAQLALAWVRAQSGQHGLPTLIPIPGATTAARVAENLTPVHLSDADLKEIDGLLASAEISGGRYDSPSSTLLFGDSPPLKE